MSFPVVAIAASAGGLEALSELLHALPAKSGMAFIVVQHLDPNHDSLLTEILGKKTQMPVYQAAERALVEPDHVYVIPPNAALTLEEDDRLHLGPRAHGRERHLPGDMLFRSLAEVRAHTGIGIVLSGGDADGALGIQAIRLAGGITFAQEPGSAKFPGMPRHAIETGCVDFVLRPKAIARELVRLGRHPYLQRNATPQVDVEVAEEATGAIVESSASRSSTRLDGRATETDDSAPMAQLEGDSAHREAERLLLARYAPAGVLVDETLNVLHFHGETAPYLEHASGPPSLNLHRIARPQLLMELGPAIQEARETGSEVRRDGLTVDGLRELSIQVIPLQRLSRERSYLILFEDASRGFHDRRPPPITGSALPESEKDRRLIQAEREVVAMREYLQATMEEQEAVKEELKSAHEEVLSANEEFQSSNEELETSKEELQSANEELQTTNEELRNRNRELAVLNAELDRARSVAEHVRAYADEIVETVRDPLVVLDHNLKVLRANRSFYSSFKTAPEATEGRELYEIANHQWDTTALRQGLGEVLSRSEPLINWEINYSIPGLGRRLLLLNARRIVGDDGRAQLILLAIEDITERRANTDKLQESGRRKDEFLAMLAHELRNPLAPLLHTINFLRRSNVEPATMKRYELMERQTHRLVRLVDELLDVARISRGLIDLKREPVDLSSIVREAANAAGARIEQYGHTLSLAVPQWPVRVDGDPVRLDQVVSNLLENAVKYTPAGGRIAVTLRDESGEAVLSVRDSGIGLAPETLERIFDLFAQVDSTLARAGGGLGLGLTVVRRVLELHGGRIEARSAGLGHGSEFIVRLPLLAVSGESVQNQRGEIHADLPVARSQRVLVVDDNVDAGDTMAALVSAWGHTVAVARDAPEALALAANFKPNKALVDIGLPGMDGYELGRRLRAMADGQDLMLIAMTGYGRAEDRKTAREAGFDVHLVKPAELTELEQLLAAES